jgi:endo-1,3(4)-beta-glucanase
VTAKAYLLKGENFFFYKNLPIKWVRIVGIVVAIEQYFNRRLYTIDDSSGRNILALTIPPAPAKPKNESTASEQRTETDTPAADPQEFDPYADVDVGSVVDVKGGVSAFRNERQINVEKMVIVKSTAQEVVLWEKRTKFRREVLNVPWLLREKDIRRCRREAERSEAEKGQKKKTKKQSRTGEVNEGDTKLPVRDSKSKSSRSDSAAKRVQTIIRDGASTGKYSALGL